MALNALQEQAVTALRQIEERMGGKDHNEQLFDHLDRVNEEIGTLAATIMTGELGNKPLPEAFADALYALAILAQKMDVNLSGALEEKLKAIAAQEPGREESSAILQ